MSAPRRIQLSRARGWRLPENTVVVSRPGPYGNPFNVVERIMVRRDGQDTSIKVQNNLLAVDLFHAWLTGRASAVVFGSELDQLRTKLAAGALTGQNLACWCGPYERCHADVLLEVANPADGVSVESAWL